MNPTNQDITPEVMMQLLSGELTPTMITRRREIRQLKKKRGLAQTRLEAEYSKMSTRALLRLKNANYWSDHPHNGEYGEDLGWWAIRKVLATREHVPTGLEAKLLRQQRAKAARGQGKSKNR